MMMNAAVSVTRTPPITPPAIAPAFGALCLGEALEEPFVGALVGAVAELKKDPSDNLYSGEAIRECVWQVAHPFDDAKLKAAFMTSRAAIVPGASNVLVVHQLPARGKDHTRSTAYVARCPVQSIE